MDKQKIEELKKLSFEDSLAKIEEIVAKMESGNLPLEAMMKMFEEGRILSSICENKLKDVERKIEILKKKSEGTSEWQDFQPDSSVMRNAPGVQEVSPPSQTPVEDNSLPF